MSLLHSFTAGDVSSCTDLHLLFKIFGIENWKILACVWAIIPVVNGLIFYKSTDCSSGRRRRNGNDNFDLCREKMFWILLLMMVCAGASEQAVSQWASTFAEKGLGVSKSIGDLAGPMAFILMGSARAFYGKFGDKIDLDKFMGGQRAAFV